MSPEPSPAGTLLPCSLESSPLLSFPLLAAVPGCLQDEQSDGDISPAFSPCRLLQGWLKLPLSNSPDFGGKPLQEKQTNKQKTHLK